MNVAEISQGDLQRRLVQNATHGIREILKMKITKEQIREILESLDPRIDPEVFKERMEW